MCEKDDRFFTASKRVGLSSDIWPSRKALKGNLKNIHMVLDLLYHKGNPPITAVVDGSIFKKIFKTILERKMLEVITFTCVLQRWNCN